MARNQRTEDVTDQIIALSQGVAMTAQAIQNERQRTNSIAKASWETMSRREKPVFVKSLRNDGYTQQEIGEMVGLSQGAISQYEKKFDMASGKK